VALAVVKVVVVEVTVSVRLLVYELVRVSVRVGVAGLATRRQSQSCWISGRGRPPRAWRASRGVKALPSAGSGRASRLPKMVVSWVTVAVAVTTEVLGLVSGGGDAWGREGRTRWPSRWRLW